MAVKHDLIEKSGAWYSYQGTRLGQGRANTCKYLEGNAEFSAELEKKVRATFATQSPIEAVITLPAEEKPEDFDDVPA
jgi:recombination protein RecA